MVTAADLAAVRHQVIEAADRAGLPLEVVTRFTLAVNEVVTNAVELNDATARIAEELNSQYVLGYTSPHGADGQFHSIRVRVPGTEHRVRARTGYVATPVRSRD